jgi:hypothetical protein
VNDNDIVISDVGSEEIRFELKGGNTVVGTHSGFED